MVCGQAGGREHDDLGCLAGGPSRSVTCFPSRQAEADATKRPLPRARKVTSVLFLKIRLFVAFFRLSLKYGLRHMCRRHQLSRCFHLY